LYRFGPMIEAITTEKIANPAASPPSTMMGA
jgi:hypothetical protein